MLAPASARGDGSDAAYPFQVLFAAESRHFWFTSRAALVSWAATRYFPRASSLLDLGCGTGSLLAALATRRESVRLTGADALVDGLRYARQRLTNVELLQLDARRLPFRDEFDVVGAFDVLEHLDDDQDVLRQMHAALRPIRRGRRIAAVETSQGAISCSEWSAQDSSSSGPRPSRRSCCL